MMEDALPTMCQLPYLTGKIREMFVKIAYEYDSSCNSQSHGPIKFKDFFKQNSDHAARTVPLFLSAIFV